MGRFIAMLQVNAADLLFTFGAFLVVYMLARFFKAGPLVAMCFGVMPPLIAYMLLHPNSPAQLMAMFS